MYLQQDNIYNYKLKWIRSPLKFSFSGFSWQALKDLTAIIILFILSIFMIYDTPQSLSKIFFLGLLILFWISEKDYFWFAFFFVLAQEPGFFFYSFEATSLHRIPLYTFLHGMSFSALDLFMILAFFKAVLKGKRKRLKLEKPLILILIYMVFSLLIAIVYGTKITTLANILRGPFYYSLIISFSYLITKRKEAYYFIFLITPFVFFTLFSQLYLIMTKVNFISLFDSVYTRLRLIEGTQELRPTIGGVLLIFFCFIFSFFLIENKENKISKKYLYLISVIAYFSVIISATRIWFVVFSFVLFGYILISKKKISSLMKIFFGLLILIIIFVFFGMISSDFFTEGTFVRLSKIVSVVKGDFHSVPTFEYRYFVRLPRLLEGVKKHIIFGCGFSDIYLRYRDYHVGFFNTILQFGILGFFFFLYFFMSYFILIKTTVEKLNPNNPLRTSLKTLALFFGGILLAHFTTWNFFQMSTDIKVPIFIAVFIGLTELFVREAEEEELLLENDRNFSEKGKLYYIRRENDTSI